MSGPSFSLPGLSSLLIRLAPCLLVLWPTVAVAQAPLLEDEVPVDGPQASLVATWRLEAAEAALESGLAVVAESLYRALPRAAGGDDAVPLGLAAALIAQGRYEAARSVLETIPEAARESRFFLYDAVARYGDGRQPEREVIRARLQRVEGESLPERDRAWWFFLRGLVATGEAAEGFFEQARDNAPTPEAGAFFEALVFREKIRRSPRDEVLLVELREQVDQLEGKAAIPFAREYAILLSNLGRSEEAVAAIDAVLEALGLELGAGRERDRLLLLRGMILGHRSSAGRATLRELVRTGTSRETMRVALQLLARAQGEVEDSELQAFLNEMIAQTEPHPLVGQMYYLRSQLALQNPETIGIAEADAKILLERFPGMRQITDVYRLLAYAALQREPRQYRTAADFLIQLREGTEDPQARRVLNRLIGDCYFLNGDYSNAVDFYRTTQSARLSGAEDTAVFLRLVTALLRSGELEAAIESIDQADFGGQLAVEDRWKAEWNVSQALQAAGRVEAALERVRLLLGAGGGGAAVPAALDLRLRWLEARLSLRMGELEGLEAKIDGILDRLSALPEAALDAGSEALLTTESLLLKGAFLLESGAVEAGVAVLRELREAYPDSSAAERSFLTEANDRAAAGEFDRAQEILLLLAERYPESALAAQALFEAAVYCERRGPDFFAEAIRIHNTLAERYENDPLVFTARLKQGNLLRMLNDFAGARVVYETVINRFPDHPRRPIAELSRADCMLALARDDAAQLEDVATVLERLIDIPNLPVDFQVEAGYKWGFALAKQGDREGAGRVFALMAGRFLLDRTVADRMGAAGRYWMGRCMLEHGSLLAADGERAEARRIYRKMVAYNLPGRNLAQARVEALAGGSAGGEPTS